MVIGDGEIGIALRWSTGDRPLHCGLLHLLIFLFLFLFPVIGLFDAPPFASHHHSNPNPIVNPTLSYSFIFQFLRSLGELPLHQFCSLTPLVVLQGHGDNNVKDGRVLSATFFDLPAPQLEWEKMATATVPRLDGAAIQINDLLYVFAGYSTINHVHSHVDIYNFTDNSWGGRFDMPKEMAHSHLGMVTDGRYIYVVTGQYGPQCRGPTAHTFVLDTKTKKWHDFPPLPVSRYAPATQLWRGRLHVMGGSKGNGHRPGLEHWSLAVKDGKALEKEWRSEIPIPRGGTSQKSEQMYTCRACVVFKDRLYVIGGQEGDFMAKHGSPIFKCSRRNEERRTFVFFLRVLSIGLFNNINSKVNHIKSSSQLDG
ncbi:kelch repeat-containing protein [Gossypium australe]|uniref:Kelch repeat-containing protein n=1 Tax=Gossypium australe TaxID=47621 RepID=A0A5B6X5K9_9ROSI|nr:kelch repeat-containing protein [Gossypium australe]